MYGNLEEYIEARTAWFLREGLSSDQLRKMYWDDNLSVPEIARRSGYHPITVYEWMRKFEIPRRDYCATSNLYYSKTKPQFLWKKKLTPEQKRLKTAGLMLYWAEGAKQGHTVDLSNTDPDLILVFLRFLREICGVAESRLRVFFYVYEKQDIAEIRRYWSSLTQIPESQFQKPYVSRYRTDRAHQNVLPYGVIHIRYSDTRLLQRLLALVQQEADAFLSLGAGTKAANWGRL
ncbi:MAG: hypothetical protein HYZ94_01695 [Candidatus Omnitrophica bacterium]|nr:hypothetical protein [Candidatus Omnitrophota bacterium]